MGDTRANRWWKATLRAGLKIRYATPAPPNSGAAPPALAESNARSEEDHRPGGLDSKIARVFRVWIARLAEVSGEDSQQFCSSNVSGSH